MRGKVFYIIVGFAAKCPTRQDCELSLQVEARTLYTENASSFHTAAMESVAGQNSFAFWLSKKWLMDLLGSISGQH
jgi:hypothetical protein